MSLFPDVPDVPGVPALAGFSSNVVGLLAADAIGLIFGGQFASLWGIFLGLIPVIIADSVVSFDYKQDWPISTYPVEDGGFQSYDKVQLPFDIRVRMAVGGTQLDRQLFLLEIDRAANSLELYNVVTPEAIYSNCNITHYDYDRTAVNGAGLLVVDIWLIEVRVTSTATFTNTQQPNGADPVAGGNVTAQPPTAQETALLPGIN